MAMTFFGIQTALDLGRDPRRERLAELVRNHREATDLLSQRRCWSRASELLAPASDRIVLGTWDLLRDGAEEAWEEWSSGLEAMASWPREDFGRDGNLLLVSVIALVEGGSNADRTLGDVCDLPESQWHQPATYAALFRTMPMLNLTNVLGSGLYLAPRPDHPGFSQRVLTGEGFEYLTAVGGR